MQSLSNGLTNSSVREHWLVELCAIQFGKRVYLPFDCSGFGCKGKWGVEKVVLMLGTMTLIGAVGRPV